MGTIFLSLANALSKNRSLPKKYRQRKVLLLMGTFVLMLVGPLLMGLAMAILGLPTLHVVLAPSRQLDTGGWFVMYGIVGVMTIALAVLALVIAFVTVLLPTFRDVAERLKIPKDDAITVGDGLRIISES